jgi:hypothetical protein
MTMEALALMSLVAFLVSLAVLIRRPSQIGLVAVLFTLLCTVIFAFLRGR